MLFSVIQDVVDFTSINFNSLKISYKDTNLRKLLSSIIGLEKIKADMRKL